jgi:hypothetical protein
LRMKMEGGPGVEQHRTRKKKKPNRSSFLLVANLMASLQGGLVRWWMGWTFKKK